MMAKNGRSPIVLLLKKFNNKIKFENKAMSNIEIENIGTDISLKPIETEMRDQTPETINETSLILSLIYIQLVVLIKF